MGPKERKTNLIQGRDPVLEDHSLAEEIQKAKGMEGIGQVTVYRQPRCWGSMTWCPCAPVGKLSWLGSYNHFYFCLRGLDSVGSQPVRSSLSRLWAAEGGPLPQQQQLPSPLELQAHWHPFSPLLVLTEAVSYRSF